MSKDYKTDYVGHNGAYIQKKEKNYPGWDTKEQLQEYTEEIKLLLSKNIFPESGTFLELGCGAGDISVIFAERGYDVYGADIAPKAIEWADEKKGELNAKFFVDNVLNIKTPEILNKKFDIILDGHCLHCIIGKDRELFLNTVVKLLRKDGVFHLGTMCNDAAIVFDQKSRDAFDMETRLTIFEDKHGERIASRYIGKHKDIIKEVKNSGLKVKNWELGKSDNYLLMDCTI